MDVRWKNLSLIFGAIVALALIYYVVLPLIPSLFAPAAGEITFENEYESMQLLMSSNNFYPSAANSLGIGDAAEIDALLAEKKENYLALGTEEGRALAELADFYRGLAELMKNKGMLGESMNDFISLASSGSSVEACLEVGVFGLNNSELAAIAESEEAFAEQAGSFADKYPDYYNQTGLEIIAKALNNDADGLRALMAENDSITGEMIETCRGAGLA